MAAVVVVVVAVGAVAALTGTVVVVVLVVEEGGCSKLKFTVRVMDDVFLTWGVVWFSKGIFDCSVDSWEEDGGGCFCGVDTKGGGGGAGMARGLSLWVGLISAGGIVAAAGRVTTTVVTIDDAMIGEDEILLPFLPSASSSFSPNSSFSLRVAV